MATSKVLEYSSKDDSSSSVPRTMAEALDWESPVDALVALSEASEGKARNLSKELLATVDELVISLNADLPPALADLPQQKSKTREENQSNPVQTAVACADSIMASLTMIASGGTQASQEIRQLEQEKRETDEHAQDVETALALRHISNRAAEALSSQRYDMAAKAVQEYTEQNRLGRHTKRAMTYAGEYSIQQMETTQQVLRKTLLEKYQLAADQNNLKVLGDLTPLLQMVQLEKEGVALYLRYLQGSMAKEWKEPPKQPITDEPQSRASRKREEARRAAEPPPPPYIQMARIYNCAVQTLRHHLPMVSYCLARADGDAAVVQLVHVQVEQEIVPLFQVYINDRQLNQVARNAQRIYSLLEERYVSMGGRIEIDHDDHESNRLGIDDANDCGFSVEVGALADVDGAMEEAALCLQHTESYVRFLRHTVNEVNKARELRYKAEAEVQRQIKERQEWASGIVQQGTEDEEKPYEPIEIIPSHTQLHEVIAEVGGYYSGIERCLLLASMQRAFIQTSTSTIDLRQYSHLGFQGHATGNDRAGARALKTSLVETCLYATRRATQRAFATGHTGTASAMANFASDCLGGVLLEVMSRRAEEAGVANLKPGEGLLEGSSGLFGFSANMIRRGAAVGAAAGAAAVGTGGIVGVENDEEARRKIDQGIACACATLNDLEVAAHHTEQLEKMLEEAIQKGFPATGHETEQLRMCVKSISPVTDSFRTASNTAVQSLISVLTPRVRNIVSDAVGADSVVGTSFMGSSVIGGGKVGDRSTVRMNYNLDDAAYKLLQLSEGCMTRLCSSLDELINPLRIHLSPKLSDALLLGILGSAAKRIEASLRRCQFTALGALSLDSDIRDLLSYAKERLDSPDLTSNVALCRACIPMARLLQISKLLHVDDLDDVLDLISSSKRKNNWDLKLDDAKTFLSLRVEFETRKVNELLSLDSDD